MKNQTQGQKTVKGGIEKKTEWKWGQRGSLCTVDSEETLVMGRGAGGGAESTDKEQGCQVRTFL